MLLRILGILSVLVLLSCYALFPFASLPKLQQLEAFPSGLQPKLAYSPPWYPSPWMDGLGDWNDAYSKAKAFVSQLTLLEKVNLTTGVGWGGEGCVGNSGSIPRLNFSGLCMQDSPVGVRFADYVSAFPAGGTVSASWDRKLWRDRGYAMGNEHSDKGVDVQLGPAVGPLGRAPAGGRNWEGFSPDPYLTGEAAYHTVKGIQEAGVIACTKHYILNEQEHFRRPRQGTSEALSSNLDDVTLHELYLWPFADAVRAGTGSIMCSYQQINNSYACQNSYLNNGILKGELGFQGFIMSDWSAQHAGVASTLAGLDMTMPGDVEFSTSNSFWGANLTLSIINGTVPEWRLDDMATRIMAAFYYVGRDDHRVLPNFNSWTKSLVDYQHVLVQEGPYDQINYRVDVRGDHADLIREHAAKSTVLLKNNHEALPLSGKEQMIAVFGADAGDNPNGPNGCVDRACDDGTLAMGWGSGTADFTYLISPLTALQNKVLENRGRIEWNTDAWSLNAHKSIASQATVSIVFVNANSGEEYLSVDGNAGDRNNLTLWKNGDENIKAVAQSCSNTIVVIHSVGPVLVDKWADNPNVTAILWAGLPGEQSGNAIVDILYGRHNPGGKLPFTIGRSKSDYGTDVLYEGNNGNNAPQVTFSEGIFIDYRNFDRQNVTPQYEFGFGLSYTTFSYTNLKIESQVAQPYRPNRGLTLPATQYGNSSKNIDQYQFPAGFNPIKTYIYPYINGTNAKEASGDPHYGETVPLPEKATDGNAQPKLPASGAPGGNPQLYDVLYIISAIIVNDGKVDGDEVVQLYINLGGPNDAPKVLRGFDRLTISSGNSAEFVAKLTRRDISNWNPVLQDWEITPYQKTVYVGPSSRNLPLSQALPAIAFAKDN